MASSDASAKQPPAWRRAVTFVAYEALFAAVLAALLVACFYGYDPREAQALARWSVLRVYLPIRGVALAAQLALSAIPGKAVTYVLDAVTLGGFIGAYWLVYHSPYSPALVAKTAAAAIGRDAAALLRVALQEVGGDVNLVVYITAALGVAWLVTVVPWFAWNALWCTCCQRSRGGAAADAKAPETAEEAAAASSASSTSAASAPQPPAATPAKRAESPRVAAAAPTPAAPAAASPLPSPGPSSGGGDDRRPKKQAKHRQ